MDAILSSWLRNGIAEVEALGRESDLFGLKVLDPQHLIFEFRCRGLVREPDGRIQEWSEHIVGVTFNDQYLRYVRPLDVLSWLAPRNPFHPNIGHGRCCIGDIAPGTPITAIAYRVFEVVSYQEYTPVEDNALNRTACAWARNNAHRFPIDDRPLKRRCGEAAGTPAGASS